MADQITLAEQIEAVESVVKMRRAHHPHAHALMSRLIGADQLEEAKNRIDRENAAMEAALATLKRFERIEKALRFYGDPNNWRYCQDKERNPLWVISLGPEMALEALNARVERGTNESTTANNGA
jgi:hypothetical protein